MRVHGPVTEAKVKAELKKFTGKIEQLPPKISAVKRVLRTREVYYIDYIGKERNTYEFIVGCQAGTYIRKLCLHPDTDILTKGGVMSARDFFERPNTVFSMNSGNIIEKEPSQVQEIKSPNKLIKLKMASGVDIVVTPDHELLASKPNGYIMTEAKDLRVGDYLVKSLTFPRCEQEVVVSDLLDNDYLIAQDEIKQACKEAFIKKYGSIREMNRKTRLDRKAFLSKSQNAITIKHLKLSGIYEEVKGNIHTFKTQKGKVITLKQLTPNLLYLLGLVASDGNNTKEKKTARYTRIKFHNSNEELIDIFLSKYKTIFPNMTISKKKVDSNLFQLDTSNSLLATLAASLGVVSPDTESDLLPILNLDNTLVNSFLKGYFDGDGSAYFKKKTKVKGHYTEICFHTVNKINAKRIHQMLLKVGISNKIFRSTIKYVVSVTDFKAKQKFIWSIGTNHPFKERKFEQILDLAKNQKIESKYVGLHFKEQIRQNKSKLSAMGGNPYRLLNSSVPLTRKFYNNCSKLVDLTKLDQLQIEKIKEVSTVKLDVDYVYDLTVPDTHNFLIETGFISSNCHDMGESLGVGAHMAKLIRTKAGPFKLKDSITLDDAFDMYRDYLKTKNEKKITKLIRPVEEAVDFLPKVWIDDDVQPRLKNGSPIFAPGVVQVEDDIKKGDLVACYTTENKLASVGYAEMDSKQMVKISKGMAVKTSIVML